LGAGSRGSAGRPVAPVVPGPRTHRRLLGTGACRDSARSGMVSRAVVSTKQCAPPARAGTGTPRLFIVSAGGGRYFNFCRCACGDAHKEGNDGGFAVADHRLSLLRVARAHPAPVWNLSSSPVPPLGARAVSGVERAGIIGQAYPETRARPVEAARAKEAG